jgi:DNA topoisomerase I
MSYTLVVTEKPSAAKRIASALSEEGEPEKLGKGIACYRIRRDGRELLIAPAVGHLFVLDEKNGGLKWNYPVFSVEWKPTYVRKGNEWAKKYFDSMEKLARDADGFISACDYDTEGSVIAWNIIRFIGGAKDGRRMKFSTLTTPDLVRAYEEMTPHLDFPRIEAGLTRHQLDWYFGVNLSRALTLSLEKGGAFRTLSTGRVQGPTLAILLKRQEEIEAFKPVPYWEIDLNGKVEKDGIEASHAKGKFWEKATADAVMKRCEGHDGRVASVEKKEQQYAPPPPFDLTTLQRESYGLFGYSPKMTLDIAQSLYEQALISYPRTSSQKLPPTIGYKSIITKLSSQLEYGELCGKLLSRPKLWPRQGAKDDPAHPALFPTGARPTKVNAYQKKLYDLITRRFLSTFGDPAVRELVKATIVVNGENFSMNGAVTLSPGWTEFYGPYDRSKETPLPPSIKEGVKVSEIALSRLDKMTQPPGRYSQASILKEMEDQELGTKATRAGILETLYDRGYIKDSSITVTDLGRAVVKALEKHCPEIVSVDLTRRFEEEMEKVEGGQKKREDVVKEAEAELLVILTKFKKEEVEIGKEIKVALKEYEKEQNTIGRCPKCGKGDMMVIRSQKTGKRFAGCNNYPNCRNAKPLPQKGSLSVSKKKCTKCGLGLIEIKGAGRRPWTLCIEHGFDYSDKKFVPASDVAKEKAKEGTAPLAKKAAKGKSVKKDAARKSRKA